MNTDYYKIFLKVVETKNISKAAQLLGYTQSGVSHIISKLEKELKMTLLLRERSGIKIADEAKPLIPIMEDLIGMEKELYQAAEKSQGLQQSCIRISTIHSVSISWLPQMMRDFLKIHPSVNFEIIERRQYYEVEKDIVNKDADCGFHIDARNPKIKFTPVLKDDYCVVMPQDHPLTALRTINPARLGDYPFLLPEEGVNNEGILELTRTLNTKKALIADMLNDYVTLSLVEQGWGVSIVPQLLVKSSKSKIAARKLEGSYYRTLGLGILADSKTAPPLKDFLDFVLSWVTAHESMTK